MLKIENKPTFRRASPLFSEVDTTLIATASAILLMFLHNLPVSAEYLYQFCANGPSLQE